MARRVGGSELSELLKTQRRLLTRRQVLVAGLGLGASALLAACGGDDDDDSPTATTAPAAPTATAAVADPTATEAAAETPTESAAADVEEVTFPVTVVHDMGETVVPAEPERIVATYDAEPLDVLIAVGLKPVFVNVSGTYDVPLAPWISEDDLEGVETVEGEAFTGLDIERIIAAQPDLILDVWADEETYPLLSGVAPTVVLKAFETTTWQTIQRTAGQATGRVQESEDAIAETERALDEAAERLAPYADRSVTLAYQWNEGINVHGGEIVIGTILTRLGLTVAAPASDEVTVLSLERWGDLADTDILLSLTFVADDMMQQESDPLFRTLPAVAEGRYTVLDSRLARAMYLESALSVRWVAPLLADAIIEAAEGRGRTLE